MYYKNEIVRYLQANNILALKLEHAVAGAEKAVANQIETIGAGAKRALYYGRCEQVPDMRSSYSSGAHPRGTS